MEKVVYKRIVSLELDHGCLRVGLVSDSNDAKDGKHAPEAVDYLMVDREQFAPHALIGSKVKMTVQFGA